MPHCYLSSRADRYICRNRFMTRNTKDALLFSARHALHRLHGSIMRQNTACGHDAELVRMAEQRQDWLEQDGRQTRFFFWQGRYDWLRHCVQLVQPTQSLSHAERQVLGLYQQDRGHGHGLFPIARISRSKYQSPI